MPHSLVSIRVHAVFSTKYRRPWIAPENQQRLWCYILGIGRQLDIHVLAIGGMEDCWDS